MTGEKRIGRGLSLLSGGLDSRLAVCVLRKQGLHVEGVVFNSPFFPIRSAKEAAAQLDIPLHIVDFTNDILELLKHPKHGFGGAMNPCIDCHARMILRAGEMMAQMGFDFVATGEVMGQRPMSQNRQSLDIVRRDSTLEGRLLRPLSALLLEPTIPEQEGIIDRTQLLGLSGRSRKPQIALAKEFGLTSWPSPAGGCMLTEKGFAHRLQEEAAHEGLDSVFTVKLLVHGRHFRLPDGTRAVVGRDAADNASLKGMKRDADVLLHTVSVPGPTVLLPECQSEADLQLASQLCAAYGDRAKVAEITVKVIRNGTEQEIAIVPPERETFRQWMI